MGSSKIVEMTLATSLAEIGRFTKGEDGPTPPASSETSRVSRPIISLSPNSLSNSKNLVAWKIGGLEDTPDRMVRNIEGVNPQD